MDILTKKLLSLFSGGDGFALAAEEMGWEVIAHCENAFFPQLVIKSRWPKSILHDDIKTTNFTVYRGIVDIITGGFPCQPFSVAGKQGGVDDERFLWDEMYRAILEVRPCWVVAENVRGLITQSGGLVFEQVQADLEAAGYEVQPYLLPAAGVNAPHERYRVLIIGYCKHDGFHATESGGNDHQPPQPPRPDTLRQPTGASGIQPGTGAIENSNQDGRGSELREKEPGFGQFGHISTGDNERLRPHDGKDKYNAYCGSSKSQRRQQYRKQEEARSSQFTGLFRDAWANFPTQPPVYFGDDGLPIESLRQRIRADCNGVISEEEIDEILSKAYRYWRKETIKIAGNAVVPQLILQIFKAIQQYENQYLQ